MINIGNTKIISIFKKLTAQQGRQAGKINMGFLIAITETNSYRRTEMQCTKQMLKVAQIAGNVEEPGSGNAHKAGRFENKK